MVSATGGKIRCQVPAAQGGNGGMLRDGVWFAGVVGRALANLRRPVVEPVVVTLSLIGKGLERCTPVGGPVWRWRRRCDPVSSSDGWATPAGAWGCRNALVALRSAAGGIWCGYAWGAGKPLTRCYGCPAVADRDCRVACEAELVMCDVDGTVGAGPYASHELCTTWARSGGLDAANAQCAALRALGVGRSRAVLSTATTTMRAAMVVFGTMLFDRARFSARGRGLEAKIPVSRLAGEGNAWTWTASASGPAPPAIFRICERIELRAAVETMHGAPCSRRIGHVIERDLLDRETASVGRTS